MLPAEEFVRSALAGSRSDAPGHTRPTREDVVRVAQRHGVEALLWEALDPGCAADEPVRDVLGGAARDGVARDVLVQLELARILEMLAAAPLRVIVFKGSALAYTVYAHPWHRPRTDTDLLASAADVQAIADVLESCGYRRSHAVSSGSFVSHQLAFERTDPHGLHHVLDVHWKIVNPQILADALTFEDLWREAVPAYQLAAAARVPSPIHSVILACVHRLAHHHGRDRLIWLYDLKLLVAPFASSDWEEFVARATERHVGGVCLDGLRQARLSLGAAVPAWVEDTLARAAPGEPSHGYVDGPVGRRAVLMSDLALLPGWRARLVLLREHAFPPADFILQRYGATRRAYLPFLYAHRLVTGAFKWLRA